jgi:hypothetical protein
MSQENELIGKKSGLLTAKKVVKTKDGNKLLCKCDCGNEKLVKAEYFKYGKVKSCGCLLSKNKIKDIKGQKSGKLTAVEFTGKIENHSAIWLCECDCGNEIEVESSDFTSGRIKSCGCLRSESHIKDLAGKKFGKLTALKRTGKTSNNSQVWLCECECGNKVEVSAGNLTSGKTNSCGCLLDKSRKKAIKKALDVRQDKYINGTDIYQLGQEPRSNNTSGVVGVNYDKSTKTWKAIIQFKNKRYYLGSSKNKEEAIKMRKEAEEKIHGEFLKWYEEQKNKEND